MFWSYILRCSNGRYYTGQTEDLERRLGQHETGAFGGYTARHRPVVLVWSQSFGTRLEALEAERVVGGWSRAKKEALIAGDWDRMSFFARPPSERFSTSLETNGRKADSSVDGRTIGCPSEQPFATPTTP